MQKQAHALTKEQNPDIQQPVIIKYCPLVRQRIVNQIITAVVYDLDFKCTPGHTKTLFSQLDCELNQILSFKDYAFIIAVLLL